ncbi:MAG: right-handed parallel beta-helix repeat-containing protein [Lentisphaeria bacterium]|nr:right-handed parallel beta-helix repeat-containing protein [Lentisphaeria bacterium]
MKQNRVHGFLKRFGILAAALLIPSLASAAESEVKASSFGFDPANATGCLQKAIDSGAKKVIVDNTGVPWVIGPVKLRSNLELVFAAGVRAEALPGGFRGRNDCMFYGNDVDNVTLRGEEGAVLEMRKADYMKPEYVWAEWRHCISVRGGCNIVIRNLTVRSSGGDGIYIAGSQRRGPSRNVLIEKVVSDDNLRQGISVISAVNLLVRDSKFINTKGGPPQCGIDLEPNTSDDMLVNNLIENCEFYGNESHGISVFLPWLTTPVSIVFRNCRVHDNGSGLHVLAQTDRKGQLQQGTILFENCEVSGNRGSVGTIYGLQKDAWTLTLRDCTLDNRQGTGPSFLFNNSRVFSNITGLTFEHCTLRPGKNPLYEVYLHSGYGVDKVGGDLKLVADDETESAADWAALRKQYPEDKELQKFEFAEIDYEKLRAREETVENPEVDFDSWLIRGRGTCLLYTGKPGTYEVDFEVVPVRPDNRPVSYLITVKLANGTEVEKIRVKEPKFTWRIESRGNQLYILDITNSTSNTALIRSKHPGFGFLVQDKLHFFRGDVKKMYFYVQPGVKFFTIELLGEGHEWVSAVLRDPEGNAAAECVQHRGAVILRGTREDVSKGEVWCLELQGEEDHFVRLGAPLIPVLSPDRDMVLMYEERSGKPE